MENRFFNRHGKSGPLLQICRGKSVLKPSNNNADEMDVDQVRIVHFQDEIIMDILSRLPVRSLHQFKCVSKLWYTLISDPYFKMKHLERAKNDQNFQKLLVNYMCQKDSTFSCHSCPLSPVQTVEDVQKLVRPLSSKRFFRIQSCCNGLVIVTVSDTIDEKHPILLLWNPSTKESVVLPSPDLRGQLFIFGLGYDSTSADYKILKLRCDEGDRALTSGILALKGGYWRKIDEHPRSIRYKLHFMQTLAFVHGAFHWIGSMSRNYSLVSFGISNEVYGEIPLPEQILCFEGNNIGVSVLDGMLCLYSSSRKQGIRTVKLWVLKDYGVKESWSALFTMEDPLTYFVIPKYRFADGEVLFWCTHVPSGGNAFRTRSGPFVYWPQGGFQNGLAFTESLISPKSLIC